MPATKRPLGWSSVSKKPRAATPEGRGTKETPASYLASASPNDQLHINRRRRCRLHELLLSNEQNGKFRAVAAVTSRGDGQQSNGSRGLTGFLYAARAAIIVFPYAAPTAIHCFARLRSVVALHQHIGANDCEETGARHGSTQTEGRGESAKHQPHPPYAY